MRNLLRVVGFAALVSVLTPTVAEAQLGAVIDWINKLTGPGFVRAGVGVVVADFDGRDQRAAPGTRLWLTGLAGWKVSEREGSDAEGRSIQMYTLQGTLDSRLLGRDGAQLRGVMGFAGHLFAGDDFDSFAAFSFPAQLVLRFPIGGTALNLGTGFNVFWFPDDAFDPLNIEVQTEGFEGAWGAHVLLEIGE